MSHGLRESQLSNSLSLDLLKQQFSGVSVQLPLDSISPIGQSSNVSVTTLAVGVSTIVGSVPATPATASVGGVPGTRAVPMTALPPVANVSAEISKEPAPLVTVPA